MKYIMIPLLSFTLLPAAQELQENASYQLVNKFSITKEPWVVAYNNADGLDIAFADRENIYTFDPKNNKTTTVKETKKQSIQYPFYNVESVLYDTESNYNPEKQHLVIMADNSTDDLTTINAFNPMINEGVIVLDQDVIMLHKTIDSLLKDLKCKQCCTEKVALDAPHLKSLEKNRKLLFKGDICSSCVQAITHCPAKQFLAVAYKRRDLYPVELRNWIRILAIGDNQPRVIDMISFSAPVLSIAFDESGNKILIGLENKEIHEYQLTNRTFIDKVKIFVIPVVALIGIGFLMS